LKKRRELTQRRRKKLESKHEVKDDAKMDVDDGNSKIKTVDENKAHGNNIEMKSKSGDASDHVKLRQQKIASFVKSQE